MSWRDYFSKSKEALQLELFLNPKVVEHNGEMKSTANTDVENKVINLDISQSPLKCALSYAYELKNLENAKKYVELNEKAKRRLISKMDYVNGVIKLEAEATYFRCSVFRALGAKEGDFPCRKDYLDIFDSVKELSKEKAIEKFALFIKESGVVRREYAAKKYYCDCYDYYSGKKNWPSFYDEQRQNSALIMNFPGYDAPEFEIRKKGFN